MGSGSAPAVRNSDLAADPLVRSFFPAIAQAVLAGASGQLRNVATTGGNLLQRTRCVYFQDVTSPCNKREPGSGCPAREGEHRNHAVLGHSEQCVATHPPTSRSRSPPSTRSCTCSAPDGERAIPLVDLYRLSGRPPAAGHGARARRPDRRRRDSAAAVRARSRYRKVRERASFSFALVSVAAALEVDGDAIGDVRIAFGGLAHKPWRAFAAEGALRGAPARRRGLRGGCRRELQQARPLRDNALQARSGPQPARAHTVGARGVSVAIALGRRRRSTGSTARRRSPAGRGMPTSTCPGRPHTRRSCSRRSRRASCAPSIRGGAGIARGARRRLARERRRAAGRARRARRPAVAARLLPRTDRRRRRRRQSRGGPSRELPRRGRLRRRAARCRAAPGPSGAVPARQGEPELPHRQRRRGRRRRRSRRRRSPSTRRTRPRRSTTTRWSRMRRSRSGRAAT